MSIGKPCNVILPMNSTLHQLQSEIASCLTGLDATQTQLRPPSALNKWRIQQIVEHLRLTYSSTETAINALLAKGSHAHAKPTDAQRVSLSAVTRCV